MPYSQTRANEFSPSLLGVVAYFLEGRVQVLRNLVVGGDRHSLRGDPHRCNVLENNFISWHSILLFNLLEARFDSYQPFLFKRQSLLHLGALQHQHSLQLRRRKAIRQNTAELLQRKAQILEGKDAVELRQLAHRVIAVAAKI